MKAYADASFLTSLYLAERHTPAAVKQLEKIYAEGHLLVIGELASLEVTNAMQLAVFRKAILPAEAIKPLASFVADLDAGVFLRKPVPATVWKNAHELSVSHTASVGCRSLDILQVASALVLNAELFLTFDNRQRSLAAAAGLNAPDLLDPAHS